MLIYTENHEEDEPTASIHNLDTGITYTLAVSVPRESDDIYYLVIMIPAEDARKARIAYEGQEAVDFWKALLFRNPYNGSAAAPSTFVARVLGVETAEPVAEADIPF